MSFCSNGEKGFTVTSSAADPIQNLIGFCRLPCFGCYLATLAGRLSGIKGFLTAALNGVFWRLSVQFSVAAYVVKAVVSERPTAGRVHSSPHVHEALTADCGRRIDGHKSALLDALNEMCTEIFQMFWWSVASEHKGNSLQVPTRNTRLCF